MGSLHRDRGTHAACRHARLASCDLPLVTCVDRAVHVSGKQPRIMTAYERHHQQQTEQRAESEASDGGPGFRLGLSFQCRISKGSEAGSGSGIGLRVQLWI